MVIKFWINSWKSHYRIYFFFSIANRRVDCWIDRNKDKWSKLCMVCDKLSQKMIEKEYSNKHNTNSKCWRREFFSPFRYSSNCNKSFSVFPNEIETSKMMVLLQFKKKSFYSLLFPIFFWSILLCCAAVVVVSHKIIYESK